MSSPSSTAGKACAECGMPEPCLQRIEADFSKQEETHTWPVEKPVKFSLLDKGNGAEGVFTIISKCSKNGCPKAELKESNSNTTTLLKSDGSQNKVLLSYKGKRDELDIVADLDSPWEYLSNITSPTDVFNGPAHYVVTTDGCYEKGSHIFVDVYPSVELRFTAGLSYEITSNIHNRTVKERRDERVKSRKMMEGVKPKNKNKLRAGWTLQTDQFENRIIGQ